jgi:hypothetical protein
MAHSDASPQRSTLVAFGAKRSFIFRTASASSVVAAGVAACTTRRPTLYDKPLFCGHFASASDHLHRWLLRARPIRNAAVGSLLDALYLARFQVSVGTNGPSGDGMGARTYVMSSPLIMLIVAFCSVPSKFGFVEP